ncbi:MAG: GntR family transcriptional regulator [Verrucomicrobiales bacterium]|jgi:GntR family transcriptional regulator|nr:GntR family transcriptional regulator [Verrucomicrobiales bacterium]
MFKQMGNVSKDGRRLPLHARVEHAVRELIGKREYQAGALLPDEITLANRFGVSRGTMRAALGRLVTEGILERRAGVGTRVARRPSESGITAWRSFSREMAGKGVQIKNLSHDYQLLVPDDRASAALQIRSGTRAWRLDRLRGWDGRPILHSRSWFHPRLGLTGGEDFSGPLYEVLEKATGAIADNAHEEFVAVAATTTMARRLAVTPQAPLLLRSHTVLDQGGRPIEFAEVHYVSSRFTLTLDLRRGDGRP